jgi:hypothetical protein
VIERATVPIAKVTAWLVSITTLIETKDSCYRENDSFDGEDSRYD